ncbi:MAG: TRAP transporter large permease subunit [Bradymonadia bacterium]
MSEPKSTEPQVNKTIPAIVVGVFLGLALIMLHGNGQLLNSQIKVWGEATWAGYNTMFTLGDVSCDLDRLTKNRQAAQAALSGKANTAAQPKDDVDALFDDDEPQAKPSPKDDVDALFEDEEPKAKPKPKDDVDALFDEESPKTEGDDVDALFDDEPKPKAGPSKAAQDLVVAARAAEENCRAKHAAYASKQKLITPGVRRYRSIHERLESFVISGTNYYKHFLVIILLLCGLVTTLTHHHISLRPVVSGPSQRVASGAQLVVHLMLLHSFWSYYQIQQGTDDGELAIYWMVGLTLLALINLFHVVTARSQNRETFSMGHLLSMPLYCIMALLSGSYFLFLKDYPSGLAAKLGLITVNAKLYLQVGLYVWVGMLLKQSLVTRRVFDVFRPLKLAPELLAILVVVGAAIPTAYSGASGIFVIAAGAIIYEELRGAGARQSLALASTAMSGSLGVVLSPCLLVVIVASLDNSVTTDELFQWGTRVFLLTAILFAGLVLWTRQNPLSIAWHADARREVVHHLRRLVPYAAAFIIGLGFCYIVLGAKLDELWAPYLLPLFMFGFLVYERRDHGDVNTSGSNDLPETLITRVFGATRESSQHIGALLFLMGMSVTLGAMVEAAEVMEAVSVDFNNVWLTMALLVVVLVIVGMTMDPYGAVILVAATIAAVAKQAGIEMIHFWMVVLVAFELGYLTPPVALNHLLTRQVVGNVDVSVESDVGFYRRHERYMLPIAVLGIALVIVAFVPLLFY